MVEHFAPPGLCVKKWEEVAGQTPSPQEKSWAGKTGGWTVVISRKQVNLYLYFKEIFLAKNARRKNEIGRREKPRAVFESVGHSLHSAFCFLPSAFYLLLSTFCLLLCLFCLPLHTLPLCFLPLTPFPFESVCKS